MLNKQDLFGSLREYLLRHPEEAVRALKNALGLRLGLPLDAFRWLAGQAKGRKAPKDVQIEAVPPGVRVGATVDAMGAVVRASAAIFIEDIQLSAQELRFEIRLADVNLKLLEPSESPVATLIQSGALDLSKPGNLVKYMPKRPAFLVAAEDDRITLDLLKHPALQSTKAEKIVALITPLLSIREIRSDWEHLDVVFEPFQNGVAGALQAVRNRL